MKRLILFTCFALALSITLGGRVNADVNDFTITSFSSDQTLSRADKQGELRITEKIEVIYTDQNHGILRAIPNNYKDRSLQIKINSVSSDSGAPAQFTTYDSNGNTILRIGDPDRTVTGRQKYTIVYTLRNVITFYDGHDELYWDVNGDQWQQPTTRVSMTLKLPADLSQIKSALCYTGSFGSSAQDCTTSVGINIIKAETTKPLGPEETLTYVAGFSKGYFEPTGTSDIVRDYWKQALGFVLPIFAIGGGSALIWWRAGRDPKGKGLVVPQYGAPTGLKPMAVGALVDFKVDNRDITATIIDLAVGGYLKIIESKKNKFMAKDTLTYKLNLLKADFSNLGVDEKLLLTELFPKPQVGAEIDISASANKLHTTATTLKKSVKDHLIDSGYLRASLLNSGSKLGTIAKPRNILLVIVFIAAGFLLANFSEGMAIAGVIGGVLVALPFWFAMNARTSKGVAAKEHILGLKHYLEVAEKDRIKKTQSPDAKYALNADEPVKTVELFEKLLPFAVVLGVEKQWGKQFEGLYKSPPDWYSGNFNNFNAVYFASSLSDGMGTAVNSAFTAPSSSGGSGFGGGGSSGGGGGGGGGGGW